MPIISIIIPTYNAEKFIIPCLNSIAFQTFQDYEIVIIDDCSSDNTIAFIEDKYTNSKSEKYNPRIRLYKNYRNVGYAGGNVNVAMSLIDPNSKYVYIIGGDDAMMNDNLEMLYNAAEESNADVVCLNCHYYTYDQDFSLPGRVKVTRLDPEIPGPRFLSDDMIDRMDRDFMRCWLPAVDWLKLYRHDFLKKTKIYFPNVLGIEDFFYNFALICLAKRVKVVKGCGYVYRQNPDSVMHVSDEKHLRKTVEGLSNSIAYMEEIFSMEMAGNLSRENQLICEAFAVSYLLQERVLRYDLSLIEIDKILREETKKGVAIDPEITRVLIHALTYALSFYFYKKDDRRKFFQLVR